MKLKILNDKPLHAKMRLNWLPTKVNVLLAVASLILLQSCGKNDNGTEDPLPDNPAICKDKPASISYGKNIFTFSYDQLGRLTGISSNNPDVPGPERPTEPKLTYVLAYSQNNQLIRISNSETGNYYTFEYNANGELVRENDFDGKNLNTGYSVAQYVNGKLSKITTHTVGTEVESAIEFEYNGSNLKQKLVKNIYDATSGTYFNAVFVYDYFMEKEKKETELLSGLPALRLIADYAGSKSIYHLEYAIWPRLLFAQEVPGIKNMLKGIQISGKHFLSDEAKLSFGYDFDKDGYSLAEKGEANRTIRRSTQSVFGGAMVDSSKVSSTFSTTIQYRCK